MADNSLSNTGRDYSIDIVRILACLVVVLMHSPYPTHDANSNLYGAISFYTSPCIGLFFMISGTLMLPVHHEMCVFLQKRLKKIVIPTLIWTIVYIILFYSSQRSDNLLITLLSIPFSVQGHGVLWFMYTLVGLYLLAPIISPWLKENRKHEIELVLALWGLTLFYPVVDRWLLVNEDVTGVLYYFSGYAGYFLLGYYIKNLNGHIKKSILLPLFMISIIIPIVNKYLNLGLSTEAL